MGELETLKHCREGFWEYFIGMFCSCKGRGDEDSFLVLSRLLGTWYFSAHNMFHIYQETQTTVRFEGFDLLSGRIMIGRLKRLLGSQWTQGELYFHGTSGHAGTIRLRYLEGQGAIQSSFKRPDQANWQASR